MNIVHIKIVFPITGVFGFGGRSYCLLGEEVEDGETIDSLLRKLGKSHQQFRQMVLSSDPDVGRLSPGFSVALNDCEVSPMQRLEETQVHGGDIVTVFPEIG